MSKENVIETDVLVIGGGMAGLFTAIKAREQGVDVILVDKNYVSRSGMVAYCDGDFAVFNPEWGDDLATVMNRISQGGEYLNNPEWTEIVLKESYERYQDLLSWGVTVREDKNSDGIKFVNPRIVSPEKRIFMRFSRAINLHHGWEYLPFVRRQAVKTGVKIMDHIMMTDFIKQDDSIMGAVGFSARSGDFYVFKAKATVVSAGSGNFRQMEANASVAFGSFDGTAMAYRAGAEISNMEFAFKAPWGAFPIDWKEEDRVSLEGREIHDTVAEYPQTAVYFSPLSLAGNLIDAEGYGNGGLLRGDELVRVHEGKGPFLIDYDGVPPEAWKMITAREVPDQKRFGKVGMDSSQATGLWRGHSSWEYTIGHTWGGGGGISSKDTRGATSLPGLYAAGDNYHNTSQGTNYPAGGTGTRNASVTGTRAGQAASEYAKRLKAVKSDDSEIARLKSYAYAPLERKGGFDTTWTTQQIQYNTFPYYILLVQHEERLKAALTNVEFLQNHIAPLVYTRDFHGLRSAHETKNRIIAAEMMLRSSLFRQESRGPHYREDYPQRDDPRWLAWTMLKNVDGEMKLTKNELPGKIWAKKLSSIPYEIRYPRRFKGEEV